MHDDALGRLDAGEPLALRWVEAGVSGLARQRDWDAVELVEVPELADRAIEELRFGTLGDGALVFAADVVEEPIVARLAAGLAGAARAPYEAVAVRRTRLEWSVAARELRVEEIELPGLDVDELLVAVGPDGSAETLADGMEPGATPAEAGSAGGQHPELAAAAARLEEIGRARYATFVVRARRAVGSRYVLTVDPL